MRLVHRLLSINLVGVLCTLAVAATGVIAARSDVDTVSEHQSATRQKIDAVVVLLRSTGYGGSIHQMKNLVLRGDESYALDYERSSAAARGAIESYRAAGSLSATEQTALDEVERMLRSYDDAVAFARSAEMTPDALDAQVRINDDDFVAAIDALLLHVDGERADAAYAILRSAEMVSGASTVAAVLSVLVGGVLGTWLAVRTASTVAAAHETIKREAAQRVAATRARDEFLANMGHEIRTPMTAILGYADLLADAPEERSERVTDAEIVRIIQSNGRYLLTVINDVLDLAKIEAGQMEITRETFDAREAVEGVVELLQPTARGKNIELEFVRLDGAPAAIRTDAVRLRQVLVNVVGNAVKFTETGGVRVEMSGEQRDGEARLRIDVIDTGIGMSPEASATVFEAFKQGSSGATRRFGGTGLGLSISRRLMDMLGGEISVRSELGAGSTFTIILGGASDAGALATQTERLRLSPVEQEDRASALRGARVLLVEDGIDNRRLIGMVLRRAGADVRTAENGREALDVMGEVASEPPVDLVLTDVQMPELDGHGLTRELRARGFQVPIVTLTAHAMESDREAALAAGCDGFATKPIDRGELIEECARHLRVAA